MAILDQEEIEKKLSHLSVEWSAPASATLQRVFKFNSYGDALEFVNKVGSIAEEQNHHPDIHLSWGKVEISVFTHEEGGLTDKDFKLARAVEKQYSGS